MRTHSRGFTIIEFMIAMTLSLLVLAALTAAFVANSRSRTEIEKANEQMESGRFGLQLLTDDLEVAGFYSQFNIDIAVEAPNGKLALPTDIKKVLPCATKLADLRFNFPVHVQGFDGGTIADDAKATDAGLDCILADATPDYDSDILVIRRTATCAAGTPNCDTVLKAAYFQASMCGKGDELNTGIADNFFRIVIADKASDSDSDPDPVDSAASGDQMHTRDCTTVASARQLLTHIYFISKTDENGDPVPTLMRAELGNVADPEDFTIVPLARGIQGLEVEYGVDSAGGDGAPDDFVDEPADVAAWRNVVTVRLGLLSRNSSPTPNHVDTKTYTLLNTAVNGGAPFKDGYKRHVYQTTVRLMNPAGRREQ